MKTLSRFLLSHYLRILLLCVAAFVGIYLLIDFFEKVDDFIDHHAVATDYLSYLVNSIPFIFVQILPLAILASMVLCLGGLGRTNELTAMRACGVSIWYITRPLLLFISALSLLLLLLNEVIVPINTQNLNDLLEVKLKGKQKTEIVSHEVWYRENNKLTNIKVASPKDKSLAGIRIIQLNDKHMIIQRIDASQASFVDGAWLASTAIVRSFDETSGDLVKKEDLSDLPLPLSKQPDDFLARERINNELTFMQLLEMSKKLEQEGYPATHQRVDMHARLASPFTCLIMGFLGIPFALQRGRNSNIALGIGISLGIGIAYFILQSFLRAFGYSGALPPFIAAWAANLVFLLLGIWLLLNSKD